MVFLADLSGDYLFTIGVFGVQYETLTPKEEKLISELQSLLSGSAGRVDLLNDHTYGQQRPFPKHTVVLVAYWLKAEDYAKWKDTEPVKAFWSSLPDDAGVWREVMTVPKSRFTHASTQDIQSGLATLVGLTQSSNEGKWQVYRSRISETPDKYTTPGDQFTSSYIAGGRASNPDKKPVFNIPKSFTNTIIKGRVRPKIPDNLIWVREAQRNPHYLSKEELETYNAELQPHAESWINHLDQERNKNGVVAFSTHIGEEKLVGSSVTPPTTSKEPVPETNQLGYFLDLAHFELAGKSHKSHVQMIKNVFGLYGPGGKFGDGKGKTILYAEIAVLKEGDMDAEYIGCWEGTGLLYLHDLDKIVSS